MSTQITTTEAAAATEVLRPLSTLENLYGFEGERMIEKPSDVKPQEAIRLGVSLVRKGDECKSRGVFVLASKMAELPTDADRDIFRKGIKAEMVNMAIETLIASKPNPKQLDALKAETALEAAKRYDNLGQHLRAAAWMLANPKAVADSVSVFTVAQLNSYLELPKEGSKDAAEKLEIRKAVLPLLAKPGTSQTAVKSAIQDAKAKIAKATEEAKPKDLRTPEQLKADALMSRQRNLVSKLRTTISEWETLVTEGVKPEELRKLLVNPAESADGSVQTLVQTLAKLAGLQVK